MIISIVAIARPAPLTVHGEAEREGEREREGGRERERGWKGEREREGGRIN